MVAPLLALAYVVGVGWGLPSEFTAAVDADVPYPPLSFVAEYGNPDIANKYPAVHYLLTLPFYAVAFAIFLVSGRLGSISSEWPYGLDEPSEAFSALIALSSLITVAMAVAVVILIGLRRLPVAGLDRAGAWAAALLLATSGVYAYYARVGNVDLPYLFWWVVALVFLHRFVLESGSRRDLLAAAALCGVAVGTKDQAAGLAVGAALTLLVLGAPGSGGIRSRARAAGLFAAAGGATYVLVAIVPNPPRWLSHLRNWTYGPAAEYREFDDTVAGHAQLALETLVRLSHAISAPALLLAAGGAWWLVRAGHRRHLALLLLPLVPYYVLIVDSVLYVQERFVLPLAVAAALLAGVAVSRLLAAAPSRRLAAAAVGAVVAFQVVAGYLPVTVAQARDTKEALAEGLPDHVTPGERLLWLGPSGNVTALPNADVYDRYRLLLPPGERAPLRSTEHVFAGNGRARWVLASGPRDFPRSDAVLVERWRHRESLLDRIHVPDMHEYYLYRLDQIEEPTAAP